MTNQDFLQTYKSKIINGLIEKKTTSKGATLWKNNYKISQENCKK